MLLPVMPANRSSSKFNNVNKDCAVTMAPNASLILVLGSMASVTCSGTYSTNPDGVLNCPTVRSLIPLVLIKKSLAFNVSNSNVTVSPDE